MHVQGDYLSRQMHGQFMRLGDALDRIEVELKEVKRDVTDNRKDISELQQDSVCLHYKIDELVKEVEHMKDEKLQKNLKFFGIYQPFEWEGYNDTEELLAVLNKFSKGRQWTLKDIEWTQRVGTTGGRNHTRPLLACFSNFSDKLAILKDSALRARLREINVRVAADKGPTTQPSTSPSYSPHLSNSSVYHVPNTSPHSCTDPVIARPHPTSSSAGFAPTQPSRPDSVFTHAQDSRSTDFHRREGSSTRASVSRHTMADSHQNRTSSSQMSHKGSLDESRPTRTFQDYSINELAATRSLNIYDSTQWPPLANRNNLSRRDYTNDLPYPPSFLYNPPSAGSFYNTQDYMFPAPSTLRQSGEWQQVHHKRSRHHSRGHPDTEKGLRNQQECLSPANHLRGQTNTEYQLQQRKVNRETHHRNSETRGGSNTLLKHNTDIIRENKLVEESCSTNRQENKASSKEPHMQLPGNQNGHKQNKKKAVDHRRIQEGAEQEKLEENDQGKTHEKQGAKVDEEKIEDEREKKQNELNKGNHEDLEREQKAHEEEENKDHDKESEEVTGDEKHNKEEKEKEGERHEDKQEEKKKDEVEKDAEEQHQEEEYEQGDDEEASGEETQEEASGEETQEEASDEETEEEASDDETQEEGNEEEQPKNEEDEERVAHVENENENENRRDKREDKIGKHNEENQEERSCLLPNAGPTLNVASMEKATQQAESPVKARKDMDARSQPCKQLAHQNKQTTTQKQGQLSKSPAKQRSMEVQPSSSSEPRPQRLNKAVPDQQQTRTNTRERSRPETTQADARTLRSHSHSKCKRQTSIHTYTRSHSLQDRRDQGPAKSAPARAERGACAHK